MPVSWPKSSGISSQGWDPFNARKDEISRDFLPEGAPRGFGRKFVGTPLRIPNGGTPRSPMPGWAPPGTPPRSRRPTRLQRPTLFRLCFGGGLDLGPVRRVDERADARSSHQNAVAAAELCNFWSTHNVHYGKSTLADIRHFSPDFAFYVISASDSRSSSPDVVASSCQSPSRISMVWSKPSTWDCAISPFASADLARASLRALTRPSANCLP